MKLPLFTFLSLVLSLVSLVLAAASDTSSVLDLTKTSDFDKVIGKGTPALVEFFAPWCGHCKKLAPTFEELASVYSAKKQSVLIAKVDADANRELGQRFGVKGFPTLMWFKGDDSKPETYTGPRDLNGMKNYIQEMSGAIGKVKTAPSPPSPVTQLTAANFDSVVLDPKKDAFVEFFAPWCGHCKNLAPIWEQLADTFKNEPNCVIGQMDADNAANKEVASRYGVSGYPTLSFFSKGSSKSADTYMQSRTLEDLVSFVNGKCMTFRTVGGGLSDLAGRMPLLDTLASKFFMAKEAADRTSVWEETKAFVERVSKSENATAEKDTAANYYIKVMDKTLKEPGYLEKETKRLASLLKKHTDGVSLLATNKFDELKRRANVLGSFVFKEMSEKSKEAAEQIIKGGHLKDEL